MINPTTVLGPKSCTLRELATVTVITTTSKATKIRRTARSKKPLPRIWEDLREDLRILTAFAGRVFGEFSVCSFTVTSVDGSDKISFRK